MAVWKVSAGRHGEREQLALDNGLAPIGWEELGNLCGIGSKEELAALCAKMFPDRKPNTVANWVNQLWAFVSRIAVGDLIAMPLKTQSAIAVGEVTGPCAFRPDLPLGARHVRPVKWLRKDIPRPAFAQDLLYSFGAAQTVAQIQRNEAEQRIRAVLAGKPDPGSVAAAASSGGDVAEPPVDLEEHALDLIRSQIAERLKGHGLARLVAAVLEAQGYRTEVSPEGPDAGADIIAGRGPMGFDPPRLCVQVKSSDQPADIKVFHELQGVMKNFGAEQGLLVSWGGFKATVIKEARQRFFEIRLWDSGNLVDELLRDYEKLPPDFQAELPLKRIWTLVPDEEED